MKIIVPSRHLRTILRLDAAVSGAVALLQIAASRQLADLLGLPQSLLLETGAFLVAYTLLLVAVARRTTVASALVATIIAVNVAWGFAGVGLLVSGAVSPTSLGVVFVLAQVLAVVVFAVLEFAGLRASVDAKARAGSSSAAPQRS